MSKSGSVLGGMLLIAGSCIGAGMLGLPIITGFAGFFPSLLAFFLAWIFMTATALMLVEVNGWFSKQVNLLSMTDKALGKWGKNICWVTYLFLFYALLVAYISGSGSLFSTLFKNSFSLNVPIWIGSFFFVALFGWIIYLGTRRVDHFNRGLMFGKIGFFILLIVIGIQFLRPGLLLRSEPKYTFSALPLLVIAFGFHNMIPSLTAYLNGDLKRVRITIVGGSVMAFVIYLIWEILVLGIVPLKGNHGLISSLMNDQEASQAIAAIAGSSAVGIFSQGLAFFAILTSFLAQALSLVHFLADGLKVSYKKQESAGLCALALGPPLILSLIYPQLFFKALNFAGGICAVVLFGILPVLMVWIGRYRDKTSARTSFKCEVGPRQSPGIEIVGEGGSIEAIQPPSPTTQSRELSRRSNLAFEACPSTSSGYRVPGGKATLIGVLLIALFIFALQLLSMCGIHLVPDPHEFIS